MKAVMLPAIAAAGSPSRPAVMTALGSISLNAARMQVEVSRLRGPESGTNPARKALATVSSSRHFISSACSSLGEPGLAGDQASLAGSPPMQASSSADSAEATALASWSERGAITPDGGWVGAVVAVSSVAGGSVGVAAGAAVGVVACVAAGAVVVVTVSVVGAGPEQAVVTAMTVRRRVSRSLSTVMAYQSEIRGVPPLYWMPCSAPDGLETISKGR